MKKVLANLMTVGSLALVMISCKKQILPASEDSFTPQGKEALSAKRDSSDVPLPATGHTLTSRDQDSLIYGRYDRLEKLQHSASSYTKYSYNGNTLTASTYVDNLLDKKIVYELDAQNGRAIESAEHEYSYPGQNVVLHNQKWFTFKYNVDGHLETKQNKYSKYERSGFSWTEEGNLNAVHFHDNYNNVLHYIRYGHSNKTDKLKLQPVRSGLDPYLKIFGKASNNMIRYLMRYESSMSVPDIHENHGFLLNADGYPTSCTIVNGFTGKRIHSFYFNYNKTP